MTLVFDEESDMLTVKFGRYPLMQTPIGKGIFKADFNGTLFEFNDSKSTVIYI